MTEKLLADDRAVADLSLYGFHNLPNDLWNFLGDAPQYLPLKVFDNLGTPLIPPCARRRDLFAVLQREHIRQIWEWICSGFVVVGVIPQAFISARTWAKGLDSELIHHVLMIFSGGPIFLVRLGQCRKSDKRQDQR